MCPTILHYKNVVATIVIILFCTLSATNIVGNEVFFVPDTNQYVITGRSAISNMSVFIDGDIVRDNTNAVCLQLMLSDSISTIGSICSISATASHVQSIPIVSAYSIYKIKIRKHESATLYLTKINCVKTIIGNITNQVVDCVFADDISFDNKNEYYFILEKYEKMVDKWKIMNVMDEVPEKLGEYFIVNVIPKSDTKRLLKYFNSVGYKGYMSKDVQQDSVTENMEQKSSKK